MDGSDPTLAQLLAERQWLARLARRLVADPAAAEDLAQETWLAAFSRAPGEVRSWRAWLGESARRLASRERRGAGRRAAREAAVARPEATPSSDELVAKSERLELVAREARALEEPFRTTLLLRYQEELEPAEIAARLGLPVDTVRARLRRGLELLRVRLERRLGPDWRAHVAFALPLSLQNTPGPAVGSGAETVTALGGLLVGKWLVGAVAAAVVVAWMLVGRGEREADRETGVGVERAAQLEPAALESTGAGAREALMETLLSNVPRAASRADSSAETASLIGRLVGVEGRPLADALVQVIRGREWEPGVRTDAEGRFRMALEDPAAVRAVRLEPDLFHEELSLRFGGNGADRPALVAGENDLGTLTSEAAGAMQGRLLERDGRPVERAWVMTSSREPNEGYPYWAGWGWSDANGEFLIGHIRAGEWAVMVHHLGHLVPKVPMEIRVGEVTPLEIRLEPAPTLSGRVVDELGRGLAAVQFWACGYYYGWSVESEADGRFEVPVGWSAPCTLNAELAGYVPASGLGIDYAPGTRDIEVVLRAAAPRRFLVVDEERRPVESFGFEVAEALVHTTGGLYAGSHPLGEVWIDAEVGDVVRFGGDGFQEKRELVREVPEGEAQIVVLERGRQVSGRVLYQGRPVAGAEVRVDRGLLPKVFHLTPYTEDYLWLNRNDLPGSPREVALDPDPSPCARISFDSRSTRTDAEGRFVVEGFDDDELALEVRSGGLGRFLAEVSVSATGDFGDLELEPLARIRGHVELALGGDLAGQLVTVKGLREQTVTTASDGSFLLEDVAAGERWLEVAPAAGRLARATAFFVRLAPGEEREVVLALEELPRARVRLRIIENGVPVVGRIGFALVALGGDGQAIEMLNPLCDDAGALELELPARGAYWLQVSRGPLGARSPEPLDLALGDQDVVLELATGSLELLLPAEFTPEEGARFELVFRRPELAEARQAVRVHQGLLVDDDRLHLGDLASRRLRIEHVPAGALELTLERDGLALGSAAVVVPTGGDVSGTLR